MCRLAAMLCLLIGCASPTVVTEEVPLRVSSGDGIVRITNRSAESVSFILATRTYLEVVDPPICNKPGGCTPSVPGLSTIAVPYAEINGYQLGERTAVLIHWLGVRGASADSVYRIVLWLR
ncbi:MAG: hypothetical protein ACR2G6_17590 [Gemmatimonadaceae bacterium]